MLTKFSENFSTIQGGLNQICSTDITKYPGSLINKPGKVFGTIETPETNNLIVSDVSPTGHIIDLSSNQETLLAYEDNLTSLPTNSSQDLIALKLKGKKISWSDVKNVGNKVVEPVKTVGKKVEKGAKKAVAKTREVVKEGKKVFVKAQNTVQKAQDGFCSQTRKLRGLNIQDTLKQKLTFPAYRWPDKKGSKVVCEDGTTDLSKCGKYRRFSFLPNYIDKYAKKLGTFTFPDVPAGFDRTVWQIDQKVVAVKQSKRLGDARPPEFNLGKCALSPGEHSVTATAYNPFDYDQRKPLATSSVPITVSENCVTSTPYPNTTPTPTSTPYPNTTPTPTPTPTSTPTPPTREINLEVNLQQQQCITGCTVTNIDTFTLAVYLPESSLASLSVPTGDRLIFVDKLTGSVSIGGVNETIYIFTVPRQRRKHRVAVLTVRTEKNGTYEVPVYITVQ